MFEHEQPRYAISVYVKGRGRGGGVAATIAADLTRWLAETVR
jgi:cell division protein FtsI/penicillin-binding protein 2